MDRGRLKKEFYNAVSNIALGLTLSTALAPPMIHTIDAIDSFRPSSVPLTEGEKTLAKSIFGDQIDPSVVKKHYVASANSNAAMATFSNNIHIYGPFYTESDYSRSRDDFNFGAFVHELTHVWQTQNRFVYYQLYKTCSRYDYKLLPQSRLEDFCVEQEASIVEDYARIFLSPNHRFGETVLLENDKLLAKIVEGQFPQARVTRLTLEEQRKIKAAPVPLF